jgi:hypothetical protein
MTGPIRSYLGKRYEHVVKSPRGTGLFVRTDIEQAYEDTATASGETTTVVSPR